ncbi:MAG: O-antigen ligase family protein, partial [Oscillospiraceae bacterium]|nr:O-antigen ligase family protein [Oscillospiraceae bacterium]
MSVKYQIKSKYIADYVLGVLVLLSCTPIRIVRFFWQYTLIAAIGWLAIRMIKSRYKPSKIVILFLAFFGVNILFTVLNDMTLSSYTDSVLTLYLRVFLYIIWIDYSIRKNKETFLDIHFYITSGLYLWQLYYQIVNPARFGVAAISGNYQNLMLSDNFLGYIFVPYMVLVCVRSYHKKGRLTFTAILMLAMCVLSIVKSQAGAGMVGVIFFAVAVLYFEWLEKWNKRKKNKQTSVWKFYLIYLVFFIGVVVFNMQYLASDFLVNILHKDISFTGRTAIWAVALETILSKPFWGYGTMPDGRTLAVNIALTSGSYHSAHNYFLELLIETGIWGLLIYVYILVVVARQIYAMRNRYLSNVLGTGMLAMFLMYISEGIVTQTPQYLVIMLAYYCAEWRINGDTGL